MQNLAGNKEADSCIQKELFLAGIPIIRGKRNSGEVPYTITGKLGDWGFTRAWYYWIASASDGNGLPLETATRMHENAYPIVGENEPKTYGQVIRVSGSCACPHPIEQVKRYDARGKLLHYDPNCNEETSFKEFLSKGLVSQEQVDAYHFVRTADEIERLAVKSLIDSYHIDTQIGLNEFANVIKG